MHRAYKWWIRRSSLTMCLRMSFLVREPRAMRSLRCAGTSLDWTFLSPPALLAPGERTGAYRMGGEELLMTGDKPAGMPVADLAVAIVDEIERPRHIRARFTVATAA